MFAQVMRSVPMTVGQVQRATSGMKCRFTVENAVTAAIYAASASVR